MKGTLLRFYMHENSRHRHVLLYEWLLQCAKSAGISGGCAFRAIAGYGRHGVLQDEHFFELAGKIPVEVDFVVTDSEALRLIEMISTENLSLIYARMPVDFGTTGSGTNSSTAE